MNELSQRFDQKDMKIVIDMEKLVLSACVKNENVTIPDSVKDLFQKDIQMEKLKTQLCMLPELIIRHGELTGYKIKTVTNIRTVCEVMNNNPVARRLCPELNSFLKLYLTIPVTTATAERTFSTMKRLKTYLRSSITQQKLNHVLILNTNKSRIQNLDLVEIAKSLKGEVTTLENSKIFY